MKFHRSIPGMIAVIGMIAVLSGCGSSTTATSPTPELDTTPPPAVSGISQLANPINGRITLMWEASPAADLAGYEVHGTINGAYQQIGSTTDRRFELPEVPGTDTFALRAVDVSGNASPFALYTLGDESEDVLY